VVEGYEISCFTITETAILLVGKIPTTDDFAVRILNYTQTQQPLTKILVASAIAEGAISSKFSMLHSSKNSRIGDGCDPTEM
jgi:hypothetical protein